MTQPGFDFSAPTRPKKRGRVPPTSVAVAQELQDCGYLEHREREVLAWLTRWQTLGPTSAELASYHWSCLPTTDQKLYVRRGLSELHAKGAVAYGPERVCTIGKRRCVTWRIASR